MQEKYDSHILNKDRARKEKDADKLSANKNSHICIMACLDFEKIVNTPRSEASALYYKRKLNVYNSTIFDVVAKQSYCYVWSENYARKGSNEVASCLLDFTEKRVAEGITEFRFYSDNCINTTLPSSIRS